MDTRYQLYFVQIKMHTLIVKPAFSFNNKIRGKKKLHETNEERQRFVDWYDYSCIQHACNNAKLQIPCAINFGFCNKERYDI